MALKIVYPVCCGMDVHKSFVVACIASTDSAGVTTYKSKRFSTFSHDLRFLDAWLSNNNCRDVCMESTGKYWIPVFNILEPTCNIVLAHPKSRLSAGRKPTNATLSGLRIFSNTISFRVALFRLTTFVNYGT